MRFVAYVLAGLFVMSHLSLPKTLPTLEGVNIQNVDLQQIQGLANTRFSLEQVGMAALVLFGLYKGCAYGYKKTVDLSGKSIAFLLKNKRNFSFAGSCLGVLTGTSLVSFGVGEWAAHGHYQKTLEATSEISQYWQPQLDVHFIPFAIISGIAIMIMSPIVHEYIG